MFHVTLLVCVLKKTFPFCSAVEALTTFMSDRSQAGHWPHNLIGISFWALFQWFRAWAFFTIVTLFFTKLCFFAILWQKSRAFSDVLTKIGFLFLWSFDKNHVFQLFFGESRSNSLIKLAFLLWLLTTFALFLHCFGLFLNFFRN